MNRLNFNITNFQKILILILIPSLITGPLLPEIISFFLCIIFLIKFYINPNYKYFNKKIFIFYSLFLITLILSSIFSKYIKLSLGTSLFYFRFILLALAISFFLNSNIKFLKYFLLVSGLIITFLSLNIIIQYLFNIDLLGNVPTDKYRYSSFFGSELKAGGFIARLMFLGVLFFIFSNNMKYKNFSIFFYFLINGCAVFLSGERTALFILILNIFIFFLYLKDFRKIIFILFICSPILLGIFIKINPQAKERMYEVTKSEIFDNNRVFIFSEIYQSHYITAYNMFKDKPIIGQGVKSFREVCKEDSYKNFYGCATHPHNFYLQFLAEIGLLGVFFLISFYLFFIFRFVNNYKLANKNLLNIVKLVLYQTIIVNLFPFMPSGNFFNNWGSINLYIPFALIIFFENFNIKNMKNLVKEFK
jgi:O-antigen ligase